MRMLRSRRATHQHIIVNEWLPVLLGEPLPDYYGYESTTNPQVSELFSNVAVHYLQTLVPAVIRAKQLVRCAERGRSRAEAEVRLCSAYYAAERLFLEQEPRFFDTFLLAMANHAAEKEDRLLVEDVRQFYFGEMDFTRRDAAADAIQAGREQGECTSPAVLLFCSAAVTSARADQPLVGGKPPLCANCV